MDSGGLEGPEIAAEACDGRMTVAVTGELDLLAAPRFEELVDDVRREPPPEIVLDLRQCTFVDSSGIRLVIRLDRLARQVGSTLKIMRPEEDRVYRPFVLVGLDTILNFS